MTDGGSQGLFVIVAVVIFGIFVFISYLLFRDTMKPSLASIFCDAFTETENRTGIEGAVCGDSGKDDGDGGNENLVQGSQRIYLEHKLSNSSKLYSYQQQITNDLVGGKEPRTGGSSTAEMYTRLDDSLSNIDVSQTTSYYMGGFEMYAKQSDYDKVKKSLQDNLKDYFNTNISDYFTQQSTYTVKYKASDDTTDYIKSMTIDGKSVTIPKDSMVEGQNLSLTFDATTVQNSFKAESVEVNDVKNYNDGKTIEFMDEVGTLYTNTSEKLEIKLKGKPINVNVTLKSGKKFDFTVTPQITMATSFYK